jgi:peptide deformylase
MDILVYPNKVLLQEAEEVEEVTPELQQLARDMLEAMYLHKGIGLAAPQVGVAKRLVVLNLTSDPESGEELVIFNPVIVRRSDELVTREEGCLSFPGITGPVSRWSRVWISGLDIEGKPVEEREASGLLSIALQHEMDHLNGILFIDKIPPASKTLIKPELNKLKEKATAK